MDWDTPVSHEGEGIPAALLSCHYQSGLTPERLEWIKKTYDSITNAAIKVYDLNESEKKILSPTSWVNYNFYNHRLKMGAKPQEVIASQIIAFTYRKRFKEMTKEEWDKLW